MRKIKGLLFDYGGTLDTGGCHWGKVIWKAYQQEQIPITWEQFKDAYVFAERTLGSQPIVQPDFTFKRMLDVKLRIELERLCAQSCYDKALAAQKHEALLSNLYQQVVEHTKQSREVLTQLHEQYAMALVSNFYGNLNTVLEELGLGNLFQCVVESAVAGVRKPDPRIFALGIDALHLNPEETAVIGDSFDKDILPAKQLNCKAIWFKGETWDDKTYDETLPDCVITDLRQLLKVFS